MNVCDECGAEIPADAELLNESHAESCSLHPANTIDAVREG